MAYTVFTPEGSPRITRLGLVAFERTLQRARAQAQPGDTIQGWSSSGAPRARWAVGSNGRMRKLADVRNRRHGDARRAG